MRKKELLGLFPEMVFCATTIQSCCGVPLKSEFIVACFFFPRPHLPMFFNDPYARFSDQGLLFPGS